jgi:hypothetical protein
MPKKIYDVIPPKLAKKIEQDVKEYLREEKSKTKHTETRRNDSKKVKQNFPVWAKVSAGVGVLIVLFFVYLFFKLPKADIKIWPNVDVLSFQQTITADKSAILTDINSAVIPAEYIEISKKMTESFPATGNASDEGKASGIITIYNKIDPPTPLTLRAGTHFMSDSGKLFRADERIVVPAGKKSGTRVTPGSIKVKVQAVEGGESYNISDSNFSIPGLKGTAYYYTVYGESDGAMTGGYDGKVKKVTEEDIQQAKDSIIKDLVSEAIADIEKQISSDYILLENAVSSEVVKSEAQTKSGTITESFNYEAEIKAKALIFKKSDIEEFSKKYIISKTPSGKELLDISIKTNYSVVSFNVSEGKASLDLEFSGRIFQTIDRNSTSLALTGKNPEQINEIIKNKMGDQLSKMEINLWPFWVSKAPKNQKRVNVILKFD